eukprot:gb/GFBE01035408.1/.p1 GENE.gb/GFBE01035408.1/~~gb/GFBE01035408.1/.p1  ORF type:complete len:358 (+),score=40.24 gb/GFBE01035408.1/:1-1074(+)
MASPAPSSANMARVILPADLHAFSSLPTAASPSAPSSPPARQVVQLPAGDGGEPRGLFKSALLCAASTACAAGGIRRSRCRRLAGERRAQAIARQARGGFEEFKPGCAVDLASESFERFARMRCGAGEGSESQVFWYCAGQLHARPGGEVLALVEGFDASLALSVSDEKMIQLSRKIFFFRDPLTNQVMTHFDGKPVRPIQYDYQVIEYSRTPNGQILPSVVQGTGAQRRVVPCMPITTQCVTPEQLLFHVPLFVDADIPGRGRYQAWEFYDFSLDSAGDRSSYLTWVRQGACPPFASDPLGAVMHLTGRRFESFEELPESIRKLILPDDGPGEYELYQAPPLDLSEVERLQRQKAH